VISVAYHADLKEVQSDPRLAALLAPARADAPFDRLAWWQGLAEHCGLRPLLAVAHDGDAAAVLPLQLADGHAAALANWYTFRWRPVVTPGADPAPLLAALATDLSARARRITLAGVPDEDGSADRLKQAFRDAGWLVSREICDTNHVLASAGRSYDAYLAARPGQLRTSLKRKAGKVACEVLTRFDPAVWAEYEAIYRESWKPTEGSPAFLAAFAAAEGEADRLRLGVARGPDGEAIAAQLWTVEGGTAFIHKLAHRESARALSPGTALTATLMRHVIDTDRVDLVDFGCGDDPYKRDWMEAQRPRYRLTMFRPLDPRNWPAILRAKVARLARPVRHG
jgi:Acetyltransferase (GNAT) domain